MNSVVLYHIIKLTANTNASTQVRAIALQKLDDSKEWLIQKGKTEKDESQKAHYAFLEAQIQQHIDKSTIDHLTAPAETPLGPPI